MIHAVSPPALLFSARLKVGGPDTKSGIRHRIA
jgi:hypothetical protein